MLLFLQKLPSPSDATSITIGIGIGGDIVVVAVAGCSPRRYCLRTPPHLFLIHSPKSSPFGTPLIQSNKVHARTSTYVYVHGLSDYAPLNKSMHANQRAGAGEGAIAVPPTIAQGIVEQTH